MDAVELDRIVSLLKDDNFKSELKAFRRSYQRLKIRLRNNHLNAQLRHVRTLINRLETTFPPKLFEKLRSNKQDRKSKLAFLKYLSQFIKGLDLVLDKAISVYGYSQPHFRVGHLVQHYIVIRASLARLTFCYKALLVYSADLYYEICKANLICKINLGRKEEEKLLDYDQVKTILIKHQCKPKLEGELDSPDLIRVSPVGTQEPKEQIGQLINRKTLRPMRACKQR